MAFTSASTSTLALPSLILTLLLGSAAFGPFLRAASPRLAVNAIAADRCLVDLQASVVDPWGRPFETTLSWKRFSVYSIGPDGSDSNGLGDDILVDRPPSLISLLLGTLPRALLWIAAALGLGAVYRRRSRPAPGTPRMLALRTVLLCAPAVICLGYHARQSASAVRSVAETEFMTVVRSFLLIPVWLALTATLGALLLLAALAWQTGDRPTRLEVPD